MKNLITALIVALFITSCAPIYKCGDPAPEKKLMAGKRLKKVVFERDSLCRNLGALELEYAKTSEALQNSQVENKNVSSKLNDLNQKYSQLMNQNLSQEEQFNQTLKQKSDELNNKEKLLSEREKALADMKKVIARQDSITKRLNDILRNALLGFNADELSVEVKNGKVYVSMTDKLLFKSGSAAVESKGKDAIKLLAEVLEKNPDIDILIEGHTDNVPIKTSLYKDNWDLSVARATSIVRILTDDLKINPKRVTASGKGEYMPRASNDAQEGRASNRRTEIILSPKLDEIMQLLQGK